MKKKILTLIAITVALNVSSQNLTVAPDTAYYDDIAGKAHAMIYNNSATSLDITWVVKNEFMDSSWSILVCDIVQCWGPTVKTKTFSLAAGDSGLLDVYFQQNGVEGHGMVTINVFDANDSSGSNLTAVYVAGDADSVDFSTGFKTIKAVNNKIILFPNPAVETITIAATDKVQYAEVYNVIGTRMKAPVVKRAKNQIVLDVRNLPKGVYFTRLYDKDKKLAGTNRFTKVN